MRSLLILGLTATYALCFTAIQAALPFMAPLRMAGLRALVGGLVLWGVMVALRRPAFPNRRAWPWVVALGLTATTIGFGAMFLSAAHTDAGIASVLANTQPLIVPVLAAIFIGDRMTRGKWAAMLLGMTGVVLIATPNSDGSDAVQIVGSALALTAAVGLAAASVIVKLAGTGIDLLPLTTWALMVGAVPLLLASKLFEMDQPTLWNGTLVAVLLFLALLGTALANAAWYGLVRQDRHDVSRLTMYLFLVPIFGLAFAVLGSGESVGPVKALGVGLIVLGLGAVARETVQG